MPAVRVDDNEQKKMPLREALTVTMNGEDYIKGIKASTHMYERSFFKIQSAAGETKLSLDYIINIYEITNTDVVWVELKSFKLLLRKLIRLVQADIAQWWAQDRRTPQIKKQLRKLSIQIQMAKPDNPQWSEGTHESQIMAVPLKRYVFGMTMRLAQRGPWDTHELHLLPEIESDDSDIEMLVQ